MYESFSCFRASTRVILKKTELFTRRITAKEFQPGKKGDLLKLPPLSEAFFAVKLIYLKAFRNSDFVTITRRITYVCGIMAAYFHNKLA